MVPHPSQRYADVLEFYCLWRWIWPECDDDEAQREEWECWLDELWEAMPPDAKDACQAAFALGYSQEVRYNLARLCARLNEDGPLGACSEGADPAAAIAGNFQRCVTFDLIQAAAVCIVDHDGQTAHTYYTGKALPELHHAAAFVAHRLLLHGIEEPLDGEWGVGDFDLPSGWRPAAELPPEDQDVLVYDGEDVAIGYWFDRWVEAASGTEIDVTHWRPLPAPPEEAT